VLTHRGTQPLPERNPEPIGEEPAADTRGRRRRRGKRDAAGTPDRVEDMSESIAAKLEAKILESWPDLVKSDPELLRQVVGSVMGVKIPRKTLDDMVMETIGDDPKLRREWAENRLQQIKRNGRSEMDIVEEGLDMLFKLNQELTKGAWPQIVNNAVVSGEARKTLVGLAGLWRDQTPTAEEDQSGSTLGSRIDPWFAGSPAQDAAPPELQQDQGSSQVNRSVRESRRKS
jgi:hypothetical protein